MRRFRFSPAILALRGRTRFPYFLFTLFFAAGGCAPPVARPIEESSLPPVRLIPALKDQGEGCKSCGGDGAACNACNFTGRCAKCEGKGLLRVPGPVVVVKVKCDEWWCGDLVRCSSCFKGSVECPRCGGDGSFRGTKCPDCHGTKSVPCGKCGGDGWRECSTCHGTGFMEKKEKTWKDEQCLACQARGVCHACQGAPHGGSGRCPQCRGSGRVREIPVGYLGISVAENRTAVLTVRIGSPAESAGLLEKDVIRSIEGVKVSDGWGVLNGIRRETPGTKITLELDRKGKLLQIDVTLGKHPFAH